MMTSKRERRRARVRNFFRVLLNVVSIGILPLWKRRMSRKYGNKGDVIGEVVDNVAQGIGNGLGE